MNAIQSKKVSNKSVVISMADLVNHPWYDTYKSKGYDGLKALMYTMGLDIHHKKGFEGQYLEHRAPISKKIVTCERYAGFERTDSGWKEIKELLNV